MNENDLLSYLHIGLPEDIRRMKLHGDLQGAIRLIDRRLSCGSLPESLRCCLMAEREILLRIPPNYPYTVSAAFKKIRTHIPDFTEEEFDTYMATGQILWIYLDGEKRIFDQFYESIIKSAPELQHRIHEPDDAANQDDAPNGQVTRDHLLNRSMQIMKDHGHLANRIRIRASVKVSDAAFTAGMFVRVHLPIPAACALQRGIRIESMTPPDGHVAPPDAPQRTVCWEETMQENHEFSVVYSYETDAVWQNTEQAAAVDAPSSVDQELAACTMEQAPHIQFTPYIRALAAELSEGCSTPLEKARKFYDYITLHCKYTYMPAYITLESIPDNCAKSLSGDCGIFALLFITLCRCVGIPAQWQSGLVADPHYAGPHDWARFYAAPFGWLYADPSFGVGAVRSGNEERRRFYFGNIDPYRMVANREFQAPFMPPKAFWRADPYDNQTGEIETAERGLRLEEYERTQEILLCEEL